MRSYRARGRQRLRAYVCHAALPRAARFRVVAEVEGRDRQGGRDLEIELVRDRLGPLADDRREVKVRVEPSHEVPDRLEIPQVL
jgi:hypothetical protein